MGVHQLLAGKAMPGMHTIPCLFFRDDLFWYTSEIDSAIRIFHLLFPPNSAPNLLALWATTVVHQLKSPVFLPWSLASANYEHLLVSHRKLHQQ
jgi:hypothetical protein